ncbi:MFS transporter [Actinoplanes sp. Pm04-4]|uniref:MFS transporter n=1 Tax=Paractinoplanes pyxinae TaxID=2997416 RepID=A0ABT4BC53_9ACTN|nr:MFS transporter [Actinoplanes pyxinae]MCY1144098.1 MFS transporter [Actinoplanes pyxinae]
MSETRSAGARLLGGFGPPLQVRRLRLLLSGQVASRTGDLVFTVAIASHTLSLNRNGSLLAFVLLAQTIGTIAMLVLSGAVTDRLGARQVLLAADVLRAAALATLSGQVLFGGTHPAVPVLVGVALGVGDGLFEPAFAVAFAQVTPAESRIGANALKSLTWRLSAIVGAAAGGVLVSTAGTATAFALAAASFLLAAAAVLRMGRWAEPAPEHRESILRDLRAGLGYLRSVPWLLALIATSGLVTSLVMAPSRALLPLVVTDRFGTPGLYSILLVAEAFGGLLAALVIGRYGALPRRGQVAVGGMLFYCLGYITASQSANAVLSVAALAMGAMAITASAVAYVSILQTSVPERYLGRVAAFDSILTIGGAPLVLAAVPVLSPYVDNSLMLAAVSAVAAASCLCCLTLRRLRVL